MHGLTKHMKSDMHTKAINLAKKPISLDIFKSTPIGRALSSASSEEKARVAKLIDLAYVIAKEELPFSKYSSFVELERRHGVALSGAYVTEHKCSEFVQLIGETMRDDVLQSLAKAPAFSILVDGSTDASVTEKELSYIKYVDQSTGQLQCHFLRLHDVADGTAAGLKAGLESTFSELGINNHKERLVAFCADGASVNMGVNRGLAALLRKEMPWLIAIHCLSHRLELAAKDTFKSTYMSEVTDLVKDLYLVYQKSPKRLRELRALAEALEADIRKLEKAFGTRWSQHRSKAIETLMHGYETIVAHLVAQAASSYGSKADAGRFKNYLKKLTSFKFVLHLLFYHILLQSLSTLSCHLQGESVNLLFAIQLFAHSMLSWKSSRPRGRSERTHRSPRCHPQNSRSSSNH